MKVYQIVSCDGFHVIHGSLYASRETAEFAIAYDLAYRYDAWLTFKATEDATLQSRDDAYSYDGTFESFIQWEYNDFIEEHEVIQ